MFYREFGFKAVLYSSVAAWAIPAQAWAQQSENVGTDVETIVVEASRRDVPLEDLPTKIRLIDREEINDQMIFSTNLVDIIGIRVPSFSPSRQKLSGAGESFRGREPLYLIDGVPQSNPLRNGSRDGFTIDPAVIERVEVLFGANAIQGVGATGGVINYVTLAPTKEDEWEFRFEAGATASNDVNGDGFGFRGATTVLRDFGKIDLVAGIAAESRGAFYDGEGRRISIDGVQGDIQDSLSLNFFVKTGWDIDPDTRLQFTANVFDLDGDGDYIQVVGDRAAGIPATSIRGEQQGQAPTNTVNTFSLDFARNNLLGGELTLQGFHRTFEAVFGGGTFGGFFNTGNEAEGELTFDQSSNNSNKTGFKATYSHSDLPIAGLTATGGVDWLRDETFQELVQTGRLWVPEVVFNSFAPFIQLDQSLLDGRALISVGVRQEIAEVQVDDFSTIFSAGAAAVDGGSPNFSKTLFNAGATFDVIDGVTLYGSYAQGFTMPDVGRVLRGISEPGQDVDTLLSIDPIIADNIEVGVSVERNGFTGNIAYFWSDSAFGQRLFANEAGIFEVRREPTQIRGFEISAEYAFDAPFIIGANFAALEGQSDQDGDGLIDEDLSAENISPDRLNIYASGDFGAGFSGRVQLSRLFDRTFNDERTDTDFDGYTLVDLAAAYDAGDLGRFELGVQNAFNADYITYFSQSVPGSVTRGDRFFAGRGRTMTLRWTAQY